MLSQVMKSMVIVEVTPAHIVSDNVYCYWLSNREISGNFRKPLSSKELEVITAKNKTNVNKKNFMMMSLIVDEYYNYMKILELNQTLFFLA